MILDVPDGKEPITWVWGELVPGIGPAAARFSQAVYTHTTLGLREFEAARLRVAQINGCLFCQDWRTERDGQITFSVEVTQKVPVWIRLTAVDTPGHGSMPNPTSSVTRIVEALNRLREHAFPARIIPPVDAMF